MAAQPSARSGFSNNALSTASLASEPLLWAVIEGLAIGAVHGPETDVLETDVVDECACVKELGVEGLPVDRRERRVELERLLDDIQYSFHFRWLHA